MNNYSSLTKDERIWFNIQILIGEVGNGGIISHYCNSGAQWNKETIEDLLLLGFADIANLLIQVNKLFPNGTPPFDLHKRNEIISKWPDEEYEDMLEEMAKQFYAREEALEKALVKHIETKLH